MSPFTTRPVSRRSFLAGSAAAGATLAAGGSLLSACGGDSGPVADRGLGAHISVVQRFSNSGLAPGKVRLPVSLADTSGILDTERTSSAGDLTARIIDAVSGETVVDSLIATRHGADLAYPYWPFRTRIDRPGTYSLVVEGTAPEGAAFQVLAAAEVKVPHPGTALPAFDTPTLADKRGVDPICTADDAPCPFHTLTLTEALASGKPVVYLIGTPAHCKTGTCAPALDGLVEVAAGTGDALSVVHAEVYTDSSATKVAPAVTAYRLSFEPVIFVADAQGTVVDRLDGVFDRDEIAAAIDEVLS